MRVGSAIVEYGKSWIQDWITEDTDIQCRIAAHGTCDDLIFNVELLQIESAQGYELSVDGKWYPWCTSRPINVAQVLSDVGLGSALIQRRKLHSAHYASVFIFNIFIGSSLTIITYQSAALVSEFYSYPALKPVIELMSWPPRASCRRRSRRAHRRFC